jgi:hypothetical protein
MCCSSASAKSATACATAGVAPAASSARVLDQRREVAPMAFVKALDDVRQQRVGRQ